MGSRISKRCLTRLSLIMAVFILVASALSCTANPTDPTPNPTNPTPTEANKAPDFTLSTLTGDKITLSEFEGTPVVLNFWSTNCGFCVQELPYFEAVAKQGGGEITVIAIDVGESASRLQQFFGDYEPTMIVALDTSREVFSNYSKKYNNLRGSIPFTLFINSEGVIQYQQLGAFRTETELRDSLHNLF